MKLHLKIWRQLNAASKGEMIEYEVSEVSEHMSFLEMLDMLNESLIQRGERVIEFDHDCREGICGQCGIMINGRAHGPLTHTTTCQLHMRSFKDGDTIYLEPFRASAFPILRDLKVNRKSFDSIIEAGGYISAAIGQTPEANSIPVSYEASEAAFDSAACIGCGACVATCKNSSAALFTSAKINHLVQLPQGKLEAADRVLSMVSQMDAMGFGNCSNTEACEVECPQDISVLNIGRMNYEYNKALLLRK
ncbi:succinate dehydrogenase/fumarate reductase iron-sulfur subunit [Flavobacterium frigidarium]|uniref:succinate dehydrogenase/fumarate reductase iron-sulfur subunit n=1 Tax=Flavobacterium frigidarium TaxID=99286 RepID=UPI00047DBC8C|nr:succinate dehydrogenase/fumarate reductase iron-sulfur subunit [Flavobacterium frigidarium]